MAAVAGFAGAIILLLGTRLGFVADDLWFASGSIELVTPRNEHWVALHSLVMDAIVRVFGNESYVPFPAAETMAHVSLAVGIYVLLDRTWFAVGAGSLVLFLGSGFEGILWISTFGIVTATSLGVWTLLALRLQRPRVAAVLLTLGFASAGVAFAWWVASIVYAWAGDRRAIRWLVLPAIVFGGWFLLFGLQNVAVHRSPTFAPDFMLVGIAASVGAVAGRWGASSSSALSAVSLGSSMRAPHDTSTPPRPSSSWSPAGSASPAWHFSSCWRLDWLRTSWLLREG